MACLQELSQTQSNHKEGLFLLPFIDQMLDRVAGHDFYYFLDGYSNYNKMAIASEDHEKPTFTCPFATFAFQRMPFGLCNTPGIFNIVCCLFFTEFIDNGVELFIDDFSVFGSSFDVCLHVLFEALKRCLRPN